MCNMLPGSGIATAKAVEAVMSRLKECIVDVAVATEVCSFFSFVLCFCRVEVVRRRLSWFLKQASGNG